MTNRDDFQAGDLVRVHTFAGEWVERIVVAVERGKVFVGTPRGFAAHLRGEVGMDVGFPACDVERVSVG